MLGKIREAPPSTTTFVPEMYEAMGEARKRAAFPISDTFPNLLIGAITILSVKLVDLA